jgi:DNA-binding MarR family transcriptional regulator
MKRHKRPAVSPPLPSEALRRLAWFRYRIRRFLRFSERMARSFHITPQQHQLLLGVAGYTGRGWATISELAEFMQGRHNAVVGLVQRAAQRGLVRKVQAGRDRRYVKVVLTHQGSAFLDKISRMNINQLRSLQFEVTKAPRSRPPAIPAAAGTE